MSVAIPAAHRVTLRECADFRIQRSGRFLVTELLRPHTVLSTSVKNGGLAESLRYLVNHQSCEAAEHFARHARIHASTLPDYHDAACAEAGLEPGAAALMGTAANMNYASIVERRCGDLCVTAAVTAGVGGNAACAGDPTSWRETAGGFEKTAPFSGTINTKLLISRSLAPGALAAAVMVMTEAKGAALQRLVVRSKYSRELATGTTTDQFCIACRSDAGVPLSAVSSAVRAGELIGLAVRDATLEALRWQNGLEASYARSIFHALGRFGLDEQTFIEDISVHLEETHLRLLKANRKAVVFEPMVSAAAFAMAAVLDRLRHGILPRDAAREALRQQAAGMAAGLAAQPGRWDEFHRALGEVDLERPERLVLAALSLGWSAKWS